MSVSKAAEAYLRTSAQSHSRAYILPLAGLKANRNNPLGPPAQEDGCGKRYGAVEPPSRVERLRRCNVAWSKGMA